MVFVLCIHVRTNINLSWMVQSKGDDRCAHIVESKGDNFGRMRIIVQEPSQGTRTSRIKEEDCKKHDATWQHISSTHHGDFCPTRCIRPFAIVIYWGAGVVWSLYVWQLVSCWARHATDQWDGKWVYGTYAYESLVAILRCTRHLQKRSQWR